LLFGVSKNAWVSNLRFVPVLANFSGYVPADCHTIVTDPKHDGHMAPAT
jgi:hypothetical protein